MIDITCGFCGKSFACYPSRPKKYCSAACGHKGRSLKSQVKATCTECGVEFVVPNSSKYNQAAMKFCCLEHMCEWRRRNGTGQTKPVTTPEDTVRCAECGKDFSCRHYGSRPRRKYCNQKCAKLASLVGERVHCHLCDKPFHLPSSRAALANGDKYFCCRDHWDEWQKRRRPTRVCQRCGKEYRRRANAGAKFCGRKCSGEAAAERCPAMLDKLQRSRPTKLEKDAHAVLEDAGLKFEKQWRMGRYLIDIAFPKEKLAVQMDGDYWHGNPAVFPALTEKQRSRKLLDQKIDAMCGDSGWAVIRMWEKDFRRCPKSLSEAVIKKLKGD